MKKPNCYSNFVDVRHLHMTLWHLALFETYRIQAEVSLSLSTSCDSLGNTHHDSTKTLLPNNIIQGKAYTLLK